MSRAEIRNRALVDKTLEISRGALPSPRVALVLLAVALLTSWIPARRVTRVDPMIALIYE